MRSFSRRSVLRVVVSLSLTPLVSACHSALGGAMDSYTDGRYPTAAAEFRAAEPEARALDRRGFASYALYRGLTHLALGDARAAMRWLGFAKQYCDSDPLIFDDRARGALLAAWRSMGYLAGEPGSAVSPKPSGALRQASDDSL